MREVSESASTCVTGTRTMFDIPAKPTQSRIPVPWCRRLVIRMSRVCRPQMPGVAFHITARTQGREPWFEEPLRPIIERHVVEGVTSTDAQFLAYVIMPNHFHIVLRQGTRTLGWIMQPIMRRIALLVQRRYRIEGHVFERRFRSVECRDADHLRRAIVYTHLNPERAGLESESYRWSSAVLYEADRDENCAVAVTSALRLFAGAPDDAEMQLRACYARYMKWRRTKDAFDNVGDLCSEAEPICAAGDAHFIKSFCALPATNGRPSLDLRDKAIELLRQIAPDQKVDVFRVSRLPSTLSARRRELIAALVQARYPGHAIANFLRISDTAVSRIATAMRYSASK
jgi:REP element-mobilizing transposase RayT